MTFLLDTNVVSEWTKNKPNAGAVAWLSEIDEDEVYLSVVTFAELRRGIERLPMGRRRKLLNEWLVEELYPRFDGRILPIDAAIADKWGVIVAQRDSRGHPIGAIDALLAATAEVHSLTLVTRNEADFKATVKSVVNPWT
jgi:toxin FitB